MNRFVFRFSLPFILWLISSGVAAIGLGELRGQPALGERPRLEIDLLGAERQSLDPSCFRLVQPAGAGDLPWLTKATISIRKATPPVLEIRSDMPLREPILQLAVQMSCGIEVSRQYMLLVSPLKDGAASVVGSPLVREIKRPVVADAPRAVRARPAPTEQTDAAPRRLPAQRVEWRLAPSRLSDRLVVSGGIDGGEPSLRLATELLSWSGGRAGAKEGQREILRLEFRMLAALNEQVTTQMATAEKLRNMEEALSELQQRTSEFARRVERNGAPADLPVVQSNQPASDIPARKLTPTAPLITSAKTSAGLSEWSLYGILLGVFLGLGGWLGWKNYRERQQVFVEDKSPTEFPDLEIDPRRDDEREELGGVDLHVEPSAMGMPMQVDVELSGGEYGQAHDVELPAITPPAAYDSMFSISAATLDEHFEANPVMELADIMLSFGRVKGAAQALQEYIDHSPQDALQPWIRLMDVYRMAGMRTEFETVAANLNKNFNVEIQQWDATQSFPGNQTIDLVLDDVAPPVAPRPESLEDMPRIISMVCELWPSGDVVGYLYQLLRDNRGGKRLGFALPVVEEILFLVELKETSNRIE